LHNSPDEEYDNFIIAHREASEKFIPLKPRIRRRVPWDSAIIDEQRKIIKQTARRRQCQPTNNNIASFNQAKEDMVKLYNSEMKDYI